MLFSVGYLGHLAGQQDWNEQNQLAHKILQPLAPSCYLAQGVATTGSVVVERRRVRHASAHVQPNSMADAGDRHPNRHEQ